MHWPWTGDAAQVVNFLLSKYEASLLYSTGKQNKTKFAALST
jgi:hypothetical protein